ncbi:MAG: ribosome small subunit-dependent GTPase A [Oscillospiraceae bacterium]
MSYNGIILNGIILKGIGGFYYVKTADGVLECRAKGIFRRRGITPLAGDRVTVEGDQSGYMVADIEPRKNCFARPPITNVDKLFLVVSSCDPKPNILVLDKLIAISCKNKIKPILVLTKTDIASAEDFVSVYTHAGYRVIDLRADESCGFAEIRDQARDSLCVFIGNSGVGKSTLMNQLCPSLELETGVTSKKLGRGKHTTRAVELFEFEGGFIADTPGFSAVDFEHSTLIVKDEIANCFTEFEPYLNSCYYTSCSHTVEKGCAVLEAVNEGKIEKSRHESYVAMYQKARENESNKY